MKSSVHQYKRANSRLDGILFVVAVAWLALSLLLLLLYRPGAAHAVQPRRPAHEFMAHYVAQPLTPPALL